MNATSIQMGKAKMIAKLMAVLAVIVLAGGAALANPVGKYVNRGTKGNGTPFSGVVTVSKTGDTYRVVWVVAGQTYTGTGIGSDDFLAVSYRSGNDTGLALYNRKSDGSWVGIWTYAGGQRIGTDVWQPR
jgi:hypothetical protein